MSVLLSPIGNAFQFLTVTGLPLNGGYIYTYQAGSSTPLTTYSDVNGLIQNPNPIIFGVDGRPPTEIWLTNGYSYKFLLTDSRNNQIQTYDNLYGILQTALATFVLFSPERAANPERIALSFAILLIPYSLIGPFVGLFIDSWSRRSILYREIGRAHV